MNRQMNRHKAASINIRKRYLKEKRRKESRAKMRGFTTAMNQRSV
jgi:hypothetical protein